MDNKKPKNYYFLYRHFDCCRDLLYVGMTSSIVNRMMQHKKNAGWFCDIDNIEIKVYTSKEDAAEAERRAIFVEAPLHNKSGTTTVKGFKGREVYIDQRTRENIYEKMLEREQDRKKIKEKEEDLKRIPIEIAETIERRKFKREFLATYNATYPNPDGSLRGAFAMFD